MTRARCEIRPYPRSRRLVSDSCEWGRKKREFSAEVYEARRMMGNYRESRLSGYKLNRFSWLAELSKFSVESEG